MHMQVMHEQFEEYINSLTLQELSPYTIEKYRRDIRLFLETHHCLSVIEKQDIIKYREKLLEGHKAVSVNTSIIALNRFFSWLNHPELKIKLVCIQQQMGHEHIISRQEYACLLKYCLEHEKKRNYLLMRSLAATGMRIGELKGLTLQAVLCRHITVQSKGKVRTVFIPDQLAALLTDYCTQVGIKEGAVFLGRDSTPIKPGSVWRMMKRTALHCNVELGNVYPHSLRHLFAKTYMQKVGNIFELADLLGHSNIETTRIYALSSQEEKMQAVNALGL